MSSEIKVNKITSSSGSTLEFGGAGDTVSVGSGATVTGFGGGKVLQVVSSFKNDTFSTSNTTTFLDVTGLSVSITPSSTSNKILVFFNIAIGPSSSALYRLMRDSTEIAPATTSGSHNSGWMIYCSSDSNISELNSGQHLDSPSTTSQITYKVQIKNRGNTFTTHINRTNSDSTDAGFGHRSSSSITAMEIAG